MSELIHYIHSMLDLFIFIGYITISYQLFSSAQMKLAASKSLLFMVLIFIFYGFNSYMFYFLDSPFDFQQFEAIRALLMIPLVFFIWKFIADNHAKLIADTIIDQNKRYLQDHDVVIEREGTSRSS